MAVDPEERERRRSEEREQALWRLTEGHGRGLDAAELVRRVLRLTPPRPGHDHSELGPAAKEEILDAFAALTHARAELDDLEGRLLDKAAATRGLPVAQRITWLEVGNAMSISDAAVSARWMRRMEHNRDPQRWIGPDGHLDMLWLDLVTAEMRKAFGIRKNRVRTSIQAQDEADLLTIQISDDANAIAAGPLDEHDNITLRATFPVPIAPATLAEESDRYWRLDADTVFNTMPTDTTFLAPAWDDNPRRLGRRLADALSTYDTSTTGRSS